jgi:hypothetical protein
MPLHVAIHAPGSSILAFCYAATTSSRIVASTVTAARADRGGGVLTYPAIARSIELRVEEEEDKENKEKRKEILLLLLLLLPKKL